MRMENKTGKKEKIRKTKIRYALYATAGVLMLLLTGCASKETVMLEEEELVQWAETAGGTDTAAGGILQGPEEEAGAERQDGEAPGEPGREERLMEPRAAAEADLGETEGKRPGNGQPAEPSTLFVHICGEVMEPGVYELPAGSRIFEAVEAAGGFTQEASESYVNLALELADGWKVEIPALGEEAADGTAGDGLGAAGDRAGISMGTGGANAGSGSAGEMAGGRENAGGTSGGPVDINTAAKQELCTLPGIGESRAEGIISYREKNGGFQKIEDIMKVEGIKEGMFSRIKDKICVRGVE